MRLVGTVDMNFDGRRDIQIEAFSSGMMIADDDDLSETSSSFKQLINNGTDPATSIDSFLNGSMYRTTPPCQSTVLFRRRCSWNRSFRCARLRGPGLTLVSNTVAFKWPRIIGQPRSNLVGPLMSQSAVRFSAAAVTAEIMRGASITEVRYYLDTNGDGRWDAGDYRPALPP